MARSLGSLTLDLILKLGGFQEGMDKAAREVDRAQQKIKSLNREGAALADSLRTPFERAQADISRYNVLLQAGAINQETFERAVRRTAQAFDAENPELQQHNKLLAEGRALMQSLLTPQEQLTAQLARYDKLLEATAIDQQTYNRAVAQAHASFRTATEGATSFGAAVGKIRGFLVGFGLPLSVVGIGAILTRNASAAIEFGDEIEKATAKTGIGAEAISELAFAAKQSDIDLAGLTTALKRMQVNLSEIASSGKANDTLTALGLTIEELKRLQPEDQFELLADRIAALKDPADRTRAAVDLFGKAGADLLPLFEDGAAGIRALREEAQRLGATLTGEQAKALAAADDSIKRLKQSWSGLARTLTAEVAPALTRVFDILSNANQSDVAAARLSEIDALLKSRGSVPGRFFPDDAALRAERDRLQIVLDREKAEKRIAAISRGGGSGVLARETDVPGFKAEEEAKKAAKRARAAFDPAPFLQEIAVTVQKITVGATEQLYRDMDAATQTSLERQLAEWEQFTANVQALVDAGRITQEEALKRNAEKTDEFLQEIEITAERMTVPVQEAIEETSEFARQAARNMQDAFAEFLFDPFEDGLDGMLENFSNTLRRMAAEIVAAQLAEQFHFEDLFSGNLGGLFGGGRGAELTPIEITAQRVPEIASAGTEAALTASAAAITTAGTTSAAAITTSGSTAAAALTTSGATLASSIIAAGSTAAAAIGAAATAGAASGGLSEIVITAARLAEGGKVLGPGTATSDSVPAWLSAGEFVVKAQAVKQPGIQDLLERINAGNGVFRGYAQGGYVYAPHMSRHLVQHFASGGIVQASAMPAANPPQTIIQQSITVNSPNGQVSKPAIMQVTAAAARGAAIADRRNN